MQIKCAVYKSAQKPDIYLYLKLGMPIDEIPDALHSLLGDLTPFLNLDLSDSTKLAQVSAQDVVSALKERGYFLQIPPGNAFNEQPFVPDYMQ